MKAFGIVLAVIGSILAFWAFAWGRSGYYESQAGALGFLACSSVVLLVIGAILINRAQAAERLIRGQGGLVTREPSVQVNAPVTPAAPVAPAVDPFVVTARHPDTPQAMLAELAYQHPQTRAAVAANPSTYLALLEWLAQFDDPEVQAALRARGR